MASEKSVVGFWGARNSLARILAACAMGFAAVFVMAGCTTDGDSGKSEGSAMEEKEEGSAPAEEKEMNEGS